MSTSSAKSSSKPPKVPIGDVTSSIKRAEGRQEVNLAAQDFSWRTQESTTIVHWCASAFCVLALVLAVVALVLAFLSTALVHKMQRANGAHNTIG